MLCCLDPHHHDRIEGVRDAIPRKHHLWYQQCQQAQFGNRTWTGKLLTASAKETDSHAQSITVSGGTT